VRDKSVFGGSWIVIAAQRFTDADAMHAASRAPHLPPIFKGLDASLPSERTILHDASRDGERIVAHESAILLWP
jgi:hypothetical protein